MTEEKNELGSCLSPAYKDRQIMVWGHCVPEASSEATHEKLEIQSKILVSSCIYQERATRS